MGTDRRTEAIDSPTAWFCALEAAKNRNDFAAAAEAVRQLRRLGVEVRFLRRTSRPKKGDAR